MEPVRRHAQTRIALDVRQQDSHLVNGRTVFLLRGKRADSKFLGSLRRLVQRGDHPDPASRLELVAVQFPYRGEPSPQARLEIAGSSSAVANLRPGPKKDRRETPDPRSSRSSFVSLDGQALGITNFLLVFGAPCC